MKVFRAGVLSCMFAAGMCGMGWAGDPVNPPGEPTSGSGMPSLQDIYDYVSAGTPAPTPGPFKNPSAGPGLR